MSNLATVLRDMDAGDDYARGAFDVLELLGLVRLGAGRAEPADRVAGMALDALRAHLADGVSAGLRWDDLDAPPPRGVDILRALEAARLAHVAQPTPARVVEAAQSIIKSRRGAEDVYLMQFDRHANRYQPVGGKREPGEADLTVTLRREMAEELGLPEAPGPDHVRLTPVGQGWDELTLSATYGILTQYTFSFFQATDIRFSIKIDEDTHWLTRSEIAAARSANGREISTIYQQALGLDLLDGLPLSLEYSDR